MVITMLTPDNSALTRCMMGALRKELSNHELRGPLRATALAKGDVTELEELVIPTVSKTDGKPSIYLIWLPSDGKLPQWATALYQRLKKHSPNAYFVWIVWLPTHPIPIGAEIFNQPDEGSFILNIDQPKGWPKKTGHSIEAKSEYLLKMIQGSPDNFFQAFIEWLKALIG